MSMIKRYRKKPIEVEPEVYLIGQRCGKTLYWKQSGGGEMKNTSYKLEITFETDKGPKELDALSIETALLTALSISVGRQITVKGGNLKISMFERDQTLADSTPFKCDDFGYKEGASLL